MKINPSHRNDESEAKKNDRPNWQDEQRRRHLNGEADAATKYRQTESALKEETKFFSILEAAAKPQKIKQSGEDASREQSDDDQKDKQAAAREGDSETRGAGGDRVERNVSSGGGQFGGSGGFGDGGVYQTANLNDNFAARSILHIADLERIISAVRTQTKIGGKREIQLELRRSVLEGLKVKITTDSAAQVQIEFLAANEKVRSQIENHSEELASILRGRGINLQSLRTMLDFNEAGKSPSPDDAGQVFSESKNTVNQSATDDSTGENTFEIETKIQGV